MKAGSALGAVISQLVKIAVTGATGYIGRELVPLLGQETVSIVLVGRDVEKLRSYFPQNRCMDYDQLLTGNEAFDMFVHLAVMNNDARAKLEDFTAVNVDLTRRLAAHARSTGTKLFVLASSLHALDLSNLDSYAATKRLAKQAVEEVMGEGSRVIYMPLMYGREIPRSLSFLQKIPSPLGILVFKCLASLKPTATVGSLAACLLHDIPEQDRVEFFLPNATRKNLLYLMFSRVLNLGFCAVAIFGFFWLFAIITVLIKMEGKGPALFRQERVGQYKAPFTIYKFRTMRVDAPQVATHESGRDQITRVGRILRKLKLDELPQIYNILRGEIALVGPRPCLYSQTELISERDKWRVFDLKPGITGLAQVTGIDMSRPVELARADASYNAQGSILFDLKIIWSTFTGRGNGDRVGTLS